MSSRYVDRNFNSSPDKSTQILIRTGTNQSEHGQSISHTITSRYEHEVNEYKVDGIT